MGLNAYMGLNANIFSQLIKGKSKKIRMMKPDNFWANPFSVALAETVCLACCAAASRASIRSTSNNDSHFQKVKVLE